MDISLSRAHAERMVAAFGDDGRRFVASWRDTLREISRAWGLRLTESLPASYGVVLAGQREGGGDVVLKLRVRDDESRAEASTLVWYAGDGAVPVLAVDDARGALLLRRLRPARDLRELDEAQAVRVVAGLILRLTASRTAALPDALPTVRSWADGFSRSGLRHSAVAAAERIFRDLATSAEAPVVLHGDLHHENVLLDGDQWLAVDPHGVMGEPAYEVGAFVRNPITTLASHSDARSMVARRLSRLAEHLALDRQRLHAWSYAQAVLAACWDVEEGADPARSLRIAEIIGAP